MSDAPSSPPSESAGHRTANDSSLRSERAVVDIHIEGQRRVVTMIRWLLYLVFVVIGYIVLRRLGPVLTPVLAAAGIAYLLDPMVDRLVDRGMSRVLAVALLLITFIGSLTLAVIILVPVVRDSVTDFIANLPDMVQRGSEWLQLNLGYEVPEKWAKALQGEQAQEVLEEFAGPAPELAAAALGGFFSVLGVLAELLLIPVFAFYFLVDWDHMVGRSRSIIPPRLRAEVVSVVSEIDSVVSIWIRGQLTVTSILAILYGACFYALGVPLAIPVGVFVGLLTIIPFLGTIVGAIITAILILLNWAGAGQAIGVTVVFVVLHLIEAAVLTPKIVGKRVGLGEAGALFAVLAGGQLLGFTGVLLAVPLAASVAVLIRRFLRYYEESEFFGAEDRDESVPAQDRDEARETLAQTKAAQAVTMDRESQSAGKSSDPPNRANDTPAGKSADTTGADTTEADTTEADNAPD